MPKRTTSAALKLVSVNGNSVIVSTEGTKAAPGSKFKSWVFKWGDGKIVSGNDEPLWQTNHDYPIIPINLEEPEITKDSYDIIFEIKDSKGGTDFAVVDNVIITRNPINPIPPGLVITDITPHSGDVGIQVTLTGYGFGAIQGGSTLTFDGTPAGSIISWSDTLIRCTVPSIGMGPAIVQVTVGAQNGQVQFDVTGTPPETADFYISTSGNDSWNGLFPDNSLGGNNGPKRNFRGASGALALLSAGKTLAVRTGISGVYQEEIQIGDIPSGTSDSNKVRIFNYNGEQVWIKPNLGSGWVMQFSNNQQYIEIDGINLDAEFCSWDVVKINAVNAGTAAHHLTFKNLTALGTLNSGLAPGSNTGNHHFLCTQLYTGSLTGFNRFSNILCKRSVGIQDGFSHAFYIQSSNNIVEECVCDGSDGWDGNAIQVFNGQVGGGVNTDNIVRYNTIKSIFTPFRCRAITCGFQSQNTQIYGNLCYNVDGSANPPAGNPTGGIAVEGNGQVLYNNTVYNCEEIGIHLYGSGTFTVRNNISRDCADNFRQDAGTSTMSNNIGDTVSGWTNIDPLFVSPGAGNFRLQSNSPAKNTSGTFIGSFDTNPPVTKDLDNVPRSTTAPSIGAYE